MDLAHIIPYYLKQCWTMAGQWETMKGQEPRHYQHTVVGDLELLICQTTSCWVSRHERLLDKSRLSLCRSVTDSNKRYKKVLRGSTPTDHVTTQIFVDSLEEQTGQCTCGNLVEKPARGDVLRQTLGLTYVGRQR